MRVHYWSRDHADGLVNLGDWLIDPILRALGHTPEPPEPGKPVLFGIGSILHTGHYAAVSKSRIVVWGSGVGASPCSLDDTRPSHGVQLDIRAVRGPVTRQAFQTTVPMGDPALLLPRLVSLPDPPASAETLFVCHCGQHPTTPDGFDAGVSMLTKPADGLSLVSRIANARFVASESLHGCIIAAAYGVPWAPCSPHNTPFGPGLNKHDDWLHYLGLTPIPALLSLSDAHGWWERYGRHGRISKLHQLLDSFPHDLEHS